MALQIEILEPLEQPHNQPIDGSLHEGFDKYQTYILSHDWSVTLEIDGILYRFIVKEGYIYDGASVPRLGWSMSRIRPDGLIRAAATLHDPLYQFQGNLNNEWITCEVFSHKTGRWTKCDRVWTRKESDQIFRALLIWADYHDRKVWVIYTAVKWGGRKAWRELG